MMAWQEIFESEYILYQGTYSTRCYVQYLSDIVTILGTKQNSRNINFLQEWMSFKVKVTISVFYCTSPNVSTRYFANWLTMGSADVQRVTSTDELLFMSASNDPLGGPKLEWHGLPPPRGTPGCTALTTVRTERLIKMITLDLFHQRCS